MSNQSISVSFSRVVSDYKDLVFVNLEQLGVNDTATIGEVAEAVDAVYGITSCIEEPSEDVMEEANTDAKSKEELYTLLSGSGLKLQSCDAFADGSWAAEVAIWKSHPDIEHVLKVVGGEEISNEVIPTEERDSVEVSSTSSVTLDKPIVGNYSFSWSGLAIDSNSNSVSPTINVTRNTLWWEGEVTGTINCSYASQYVLSSILVDSGDDGEQGEATVWCFFMGTSDTLELTQPIESDLDVSDYCPYVGKVVIPDKDLPIWASTTTEFYCQCSNTVAYRTYSPEPTAEQLSEYIYPGTTETIHGGFVDCNEHDQNISDPYYYEEKCCELPLISLPVCKTLRTKNEGGKSLSAEKQAAYVARFSPKPVSFIATSPRDGDCGSIIYSQALHALNCCDEIASIGIDYDSSPDVMPAGQSITIYFDGGEPPFTATLTNIETSFSGGQRKAVFYTNYVRIFSTEDFCGSTSFTVEDKCTAASMSIRSDLGQWELVSLDTCSMPGGVGEPYTVNVPGLSATGHACIIGADMQFEQQVGVSSRDTEILQETDGYAGGIYVTDKVIGLHCPPLNGAECSDDNLTVYDSHCACAANVGMPYITNHTCLSSTRPDPSGDGNGYQCDEDMYLWSAGYGSIYCPSVISGGISYFFAAWMESAIKATLRWVC